MYHIYLTSLNMILFSWKKEGNKERERERDWVRCLVVTIVKEQREPHGTRHHHRRGLNTKSTTADHSSAVEHFALRTRSSRSFHTECHQTSARKDGIVSITPENGACPPSSPPLRQLTLFDSTNGRSSRYYHHLPEVILLERSLQRYVY